MKLVYCEICGDIFNLKRQKKSCGCGNVHGNYEEDGVRAAIFVDNPGTAWPLGFANSSFLINLAKQKLRSDHAQKWGDRFEAFFIPLLAGTISIYQGMHREKFVEGQNYIDKR